MKFSEIKHNYVWGPLAEPGHAATHEDGILAGISIDAWETDNDEEPGVVLANVILTICGNIIVDYHDNGVRLNDQVLAHISAAREQLNEMWQDYAVKRRESNPEQTKVCCTAVLTIPRPVMVQINRHLNANSEDDYQGEDNTITYTAQFPDGKEMDIKCCGCREEASWTEAVLFDERGGQLCFTEPADSYDGTWTLECDGVEYIVTVVSAQAEDGPSVEDKASDNSSQPDEEGICPLCGAEINYCGDHEIDDVGGTVPWECPDCGATGKEGYNRVFDQHYDVCDASGEPAPDRES